MEEKFRVALKNFKKLITVTIGVTTLEELHQKIEFSFSKCPKFKKNFRLQYYEDSFEEFVDLDNIEDLTCVIDKRFVLLAIISYLYVTATKCLTILSFIKVVITFTFQINNTLLILGCRSLLNKMKVMWKQAMMSALFYREKYVFRCYSE